MKILLITTDVFIPEEELSFSASRSSGPGGQNVNKVNTKVTLLFNIDNSSHLTEVHKEMIHQKLSSRITKRGELIIASQRFRTQRANRNDTVDRFINLLKNALQEQPVRHATKIPKSLNEKRLKEKKLRSDIKKKRINGVRLCIRDSHE